MRQMFEVFIYGDVPQVIDVPAETAEAAVNDALMEVLNRLEFRAHLKNDPASPVVAIPPEAKKRRSAGQEKK